MLVGACAVFIESSYKFRSTIFVEKFVICETDFVFKRTEAKPCLFNFPVVT